MTDTIQDGKTHRVPLVFLGGPIKHWWTCWGSDEHQHYQQHRERVRHWLIEAGYLTYAPWEAIKGTWDDKAQNINLFAIGMSDLFVNLAPWGVPAEETEREADFAKSCDVLCTRVVPALTHGDFMCFLRTAIGPGIPYERS